MGWLNRHPFPVEAFFEKSLVLGFAVPRDDLARRIPECLELDLFEERWGFLAAAMVRTRGLRPRGLPEMFGREFTLIGYRIFVRYRNRKGRRLRGLYILGSETDRRSMRRLGGIFTQYRYDLVPIAWSSEAGSEQITSERGLRVVASKTTEEAALPVSSPFADWRQARRFAGPMPFTFSYQRETREVTIVEGVRSDWTPVPLEVAEWTIPFLEALELAELRLANAFIVENVPYHWKRGRVERWKR